MTALLPIPSKEILPKLPPSYPNFDSFIKGFSLGKIVTEKQNPITLNLSAVAKKDLIEGLGLLLRVDEGVVQGFIEFSPLVAEISKELQEKMSQGGSVFFVGCGSSGRVALDLAARSEDPRVIGVIAGGDSAFVKALEGFEDSSEKGAQALKKYFIRANDTVFLISASGSATFNVGSGHAAANAGAKVYYFFNSKEVLDVTNESLDRTRALFERKVNPVIPLCVDIGPQAITGSTRLQAASLAMGLGALFDPNENFSKKLNEANALIRTHLTDIAAFVKREVEVLGSPTSNFRRCRDETNQGYVTLVGSKRTIRPALVDTTEIPPTFSTNPPRERGQTTKLPEFAAYLFTSDEICNNVQAWETLLGREAAPEFLENMKKYTLGIDVSEGDSFEKRPKGKGNFVFGVEILRVNERISKEWLEYLGKEDGMIVLCEGELHPDDRALLSDLHTIIYENVPQDRQHMIETILLKQTLNLISNGTMILLNKVVGNLMVDVRASNLKLVNRCMRQIQQIWNEPLDKKWLYYVVASMYEKKKVYDAMPNYSPSIVILVLAMLAMNKTPEDFEEIVAELATRKEDVETLLNRPIH